MSAAGAIAGVTFLEAMREKVLYVLGGFAMIAFAASRLAAPLALGEGRRIVCDLGVFALSAFGLLVVIFVGRSLIFREIERGSVAFIFSRPVGRGAFIAGKFAGLALVIAVTEIAMGGILAIVLVASRYAVGAALAGAVLLSILQLWILSAVTILLASLASPVTAGLFILGAWVIGNTAEALARMPGFGPVLWIVPRLDLYNGAAWLVHGTAPSLERWAFLSAYAGIYILASLLLARAAFARRALMG